MSCTKNPKNILGIKFLGEHDFRPSRIDLMVKSPALYRLTEYCTLCGINQESVFQSIKDLLEHGFTENHLRTVGFYNSVTHPDLLSE